MWIIPPSIRSAYAQASACSTKDSMPDLDTWASEAARSCTLNGKHTLSPSWKRAWKKEAYLQRLSGSAISPNSRQASFTEWWIASLPDSRVKICLSPENAPDLTASAAACSLKSSASQPIAVRGSCFWRTSQASLLQPPPLWTRKKANSTKERPPASWENWPTSGGIRNGSLYQRPTWEPATAGQGGSALHGENWEIPKANERSGNQTNSNGQAHLCTQANTWATPTSNEHTGAGHPSSKQGAENLRTQADQWKSPRASDGAKGGPNQCGSKGDLMLTSQASQWPTPASRDHKGANSAEHALVTGGGRKHMDQLANFVAYSPLALAMRDGETSSPENLGAAQHSANPSSEPQEKDTRRLNPYFAEHLMGWPLGWTSTTEPHASNASATASFRCALRWQLSSLLGEQESHKEAP